MAKKMKWNAGSVARLQSLDEATCPTPEKIRFEIKAVAKKKARQNGLTVYKCRCGYYHTTSHRRRKEQERKKDV